MEIISELHLYCVQIGEDLFFITVIILILQIDVSRHEDPLCNSVHQEFTDLGVAVLASLGGGHLNNLAGSAFQDNKAVFAQGRTLHGVGGGCPSITSLEIQLCICHACCRGQKKRRVRRCVYLAFQLKLNPVLIFTSLTGPTNTNS